MFQRKGYLHDLPIFSVIMALYIFLLVHSRAVHLFGNCELVVIAMALYRHSSTLSSWVLDDFGSIPAAEILFMSPLGSISQNLECSYYLP